MVELYHWEPNGFFLKPLIALKEKGVSFASHYVDPTDLAAAGPANLNLEAKNNPENEGPVLVHQGETIVESFFMLEYIDEAFPQAPRLLPGDPDGNWWARVWGRFLGESTAPAVSTLGCHRFLAPRLKERRLNEVEGVLDRFTSPMRRAAWAAALDDSYGDELIEESRRKLGLAIKRVEEALAGSRPWLAGYSYTITDIEAFALLNSAPKLAPDLCNAEASPRMIAWLERMRARPAVQAALAMSRTGTPDEAFAPGPEHARWG